MILCCEHICFHLYIGCSSNYLMYNVAIYWAFVIILDAVDIMSCTNSILVCANVFAPFDVFIKLGVLDILR